MRRYLNLIVICDRFHVCGECGFIHKEHYNVGHKHYDVLYG
ncbi:hypothetical protein [Fischerella muscicola]|nr:hypothetical protein [Fischerella muscicola]